MEQHDRRPIGIARPEIDDIEMRAGNLGGYADLQGQIKTLIDQLSGLVPN